MDHLRVRALEAEARRKAHEAGTATMLCGVLLCVPVLGQLGAAYALSGSSDVMAFLLLLIPAGCFVIVGWAIRKGLAWAFQAGLAVFVLSGFAAGGAYFAMLGAALPMGLACLSIGLAAATWRARLAHADLREARAAAATALSHRP